MERQCENCGTIFKAFQNRRLCDECDELRNPALSTVLFKILQPEKNDNGIDKPKKIGNICLSIKKRIYFYQDTLTIGDPKEYFNSDLYPSLSDEFRKKILNNKVETGKKYDVYRIGCKNCKEILLTLSPNRKYCLNCVEIQNNKNKRLHRNKIRNMYKLTKQETEELQNRGFEPFDYYLSPNLGTGNLGSHKDPDEIKELEKVQNELKNLRIKKM